MSRVRRLPALAVLAAALLLVAGCGKTVVDDAKTEAALEQELEGSVDGEIRTVECPSGVEVEAGMTFECAVALTGGKEETVTLRIANEDADLEVTDLQPAK